MKTKKRKKSSRFRGSHTHGRGGKKKARGSGHRGGFGMAGTGKRADHRKSYVHNLYGNDYFKKDKVLAKKIKIKLKSINLDQITPENTNLLGYKILSRGELSFKGKIKASAVSSSALDKIKKSGSEIILPEIKEIKEEKKENKKE